MIKSKNEERLVRASGLSICQVCCNKQAFDYSFKDINKKIILKGPHMARRPKHIMHKDRLRDVGLFSLVKTRQRGNLIAIPSS